MKLVQSDLLDSIDTYLYSVQEIDMLTKLKLAVSTDILFTLQKHELILYKE